MRIINTEYSPKLNFQGYKQHFTNDELRLKLTEAFERQNKQKNLLSKVEKKVNTLDKYKNIFKKGEFEPVVELSLNGDNLEGEITSFNATTIGLKTPITSRLKPFFKRIVSLSKMQVKEDMLKQKLWTISNQEKYLEARLNNRLKELSQDNDSKSLFRAVFDLEYEDLTQQLLQVVNKRNKIVVELEDVQNKLKKFKTT